ncbi:hypothetical protein ACFX1Q_001992 [Malus domestica]
MALWRSANVPSNVAVELGLILRMNPVSDPGFYLGFPAVLGCSKRQGLVFVKDKIMGKLQGWKRCSLSQTGDEVLIKVVVQAITAYSMHLFKFLVGIYHELDALISAFWWGTATGECNIHWVAKETIGLSKNQGVLGFRNFQELNNVFLVKQCWRLLHNSTSLWARVLKAWCFPHCSLLDAKKGCRASCLWSSLLGHPILMGRATVSRNTCVKSLICPNTKTWNNDFLEGVISREHMRAIRDLNIGDVSKSDQLVWPYDERGSFTVKSGYH